VKFPKKLRYKKRGRPLATIYRRPDCYRLYWRVRQADGKPSSQFKDFSTYTEAKRKGDKIVEDLAKGKALVLTPGQLNDALAAFKTLQEFYRTTGKRVSLHEAASQFTTAASKLLENTTFTDAIDGYLTSVAMIHRKGIKEAVDQFLLERELKTKAKDGKRAQLSKEYHYLIGLWLKKFATTFPATAVCELTKGHLDKYMQQHSERSAKTRNHFRGTVKMFLKWAVSKDYLSPAHRLFEAGGLKHEPADGGEIECYTANELRGLLERASKLLAAPKKGQEPEADFRDLLPVIALAGLAGLRFKEITRLTWEDVFSKPDHIEVKAAKSKTRSRRLIPMCSALAGWLEPYRDRKGIVWPKGYDMLHEDFADLREAVDVPNRKNGLRHSFISAHFAAHSDENLTAAQAGNSPAMIHQHYKGLLTRKEGEAWFCVAPAQPSNVIALTAAPKK
jgi:integrase